MGAAATWYSRPCLRLAPRWQRGLFGVSVLHQRSGADNPPFWPGEWGGGRRHPWDGHFPSANSEPSLSAQLPTGASANRSRVLIPTFLQPSPVATPGLGTSMRGRQSAPSCLPEEWWVEQRVVQEWGRTDYSGEPPPEAEGVLVLGAGTEQPRKHSAEHAPPAHHPEPCSLFRSQLPRRYLPPPQPQKVPTGRPVHASCPSGRCCWLQEEKDLVVPSSQHSVWRETKSKGRTRGAGGGDTQFLLPGLARCGQQSSGPPKTPTTQPPEPVSMCSDVAHGSLWVGSRPPEAGR